MTPVSKKNTPGRILLCKIQVNYTTQPLYIREAEQRIPIDLKLFMINLPYLKKIPHFVRNLFFAGRNFQQRGNLYNFLHCKKVFYSFILSVLLFPVAVFADEALPPAAETSSPSSSLPQPTGSSETPTTFKERKDKEGYVLNLKDLIKESKKKIENVNDKLNDQARQRRNQQREEKAREYYEKAMHLFEEGRLEDAQELWLKAIKITEHPEMKDYISESVKKTKKQEDLLLREEHMRVKELEIERGYSAKEVEAAYQRAVTYYKKQDYLDAKDEFEKVDEMFPDHKATRSYLMVLDQEIQQEQQKLIDEQLEGKVSTKRLEKEEWRRRLEEKERHQQMTLEEQAEAAYREAVKFYKDRKFTQAKDKFREVEWILPNYKSTLQYLARVDRDIKEEEKRLALQGSREEDSELDDRLTDEKYKKDLKIKSRAYKSQEEVNRIKDEADFVYETALNLYHKKDYEKALNKFEEVDELYPNYKKTGKYIRELNKLIGTEENKVSEKQLAQFEKELKDAKRAVNHEQQRQSKSDRFKTDLSSQRVLDEAEILYSAGVSLFKSQLYKQASHKFMDVEKIQPNYKLTRRYQERIELLLNTTKGVETKEFNALTQLDSKLTSEEQSLQKAITEREEKMAQEAEEKYKQAVKFYKMEYYVDAKLKFIQVEALMPDYKDVGDYLDRIDDDIAKSRKSKKLNPALKAEIVRKSASDGSKQRVQKAIVKKYDPENQTIEIPVVKKHKRIPLPRVEKTDGKFYSQTDASLQSMAQIKAQDEYLAESKKREYEEFQKNMRKERAAIKKAENLHRDGQRKIKEDLKKKMFDKDRQKKKEKLSKQQAQKKEATLLPDLVLEQEVKAAVPETAEVKEESVKPPSLSKSERDRLRRLEKLEKVRQQTEEEMVALQAKADAKVVEKKKEKPIIEKKESAPDPVAKISSKEKVVSSKPKKELGPSVKKLKDDELAAIDPAKLSPEVRQKYERRVAVKQVKHMRSAENKLVQKQKKVITQQTRKIKSQLAHKKKVEERRWGGETARVYADAVKLFKDGRYAAAQTEFNSVEQMNEDYKSTRQYLDEIDILLKQQKVRINKDEMKAQETSLRKEIRENQLKAKEAKQAEKAKQFEEILKAKEAKQAEKAKQFEEILKAKEAKQAEEQKKIDETNKAKEAEAAKKAEELQKAKEVKQAEAAKKTEELKKAKEAEAAKKAEELKKAREAKKSKKPEKIKELKKAEKAQKIKANEESKEIQQAKKSKNIEKNLKDIKADTAKELKKLRKTDGVKEALQKENESLKRNIYKNEIAYRKAMENLEIRKLKEERVYLKEKEAVAKRSNLDAMAKAQNIKLEREKLQKKDAEKITIDTLKSAKQKDIDEKKRQNEEILRMRREIDLTYQDALKLTKMNNIELAREKFKKLDQLITTSQVPENYRTQMHQRMGQGRSRLELMFEREREKNEKIAKKEMNKVTEKDIQAEDKEAMKDSTNEKTREVLDAEALRKKIEEEDQKLAKEKEAEALRLKNEEEKKKKLEKQKAEKEIVTQKVVKEPVKKDVPELFLGEDEEIKESEEKKRRELETLVKQRQENLRQDRLHMIDELNQSVNRLYTKAQNLYDSGYYSEAKYLFVEVEDLKPGYKKTTTYLNKIAEQDKVSSRAPQVQVSQKPQNKAPKKSKKAKTRQDLINDALNSVETKND